MTLHPQSVAALALQRAGTRVGDPGFGYEDLVTLRREQVELAASEECEDVTRVEDLDEHGLAARLYVPDSAGTRRQRVVVYLHGGGFALGDRDTHDAHARRIANRTGSVVLSVDYRRPPEHPFPAAVQDCDAALDWLTGRGSSVGLDVGGVVLAGDSAGANLALVTALHRPGVPAATVLAYPFVDASMTGASYDVPDGGITRADAEFFWRQYASSPADYEHPDLSPIRSEALGVLAPTLVQIAEHDALADEDRELVRLLAAAGVDVEATTYDGMIHGFWRHPEQFDAAEDALAEIVAFLDRRVPRGL